MSQIEAQRKPRIVVTLSLPTSQKQLHLGLFPPGKYLIFILNTNNFYLKLHVQLVKQPNTLFQNVSFPGDSQNILWFFFQANNGVLVLKGTECSQLQLVYLI